MPDTYLTKPAEKLYDLSKLKKGRHFRFAKEHMELHRLCQWSPYLDYKVVGELAPVASAFEITYQLKSIVAIEDESKQPIFGEKHVIQIHLPNLYPQEPARCKAISDLWHPNIKWYGKYKGRICANNKEFGKLYSIAELALGIGEMIQYKNYHALNTPPYPEDEKVAQWIRDFAEPQKIVALSPPIVIDETHLQMPPEDWMPEEVKPEPGDPKGPQRLGFMKIKDIKGGDQKTPPPSGSSDIRFRRKDS